MKDILIRAPVLQYLDSLSNAVLAETIRAVIRMSDGETSVALSPEAVWAINRIAALEAEGRASVESEFARFWDEFAKKVARREAEKAFRRARESKEWPGIDSIIRTLRMWNATDQWRRDGGKYKPYPATWLNGRRWLDEMPSRTGALAPTSQEAESNDFF